MASIMDFDASSLLGYRLVASQSRGVEILQPYVLFLFAETNYRFGVHGLRSKKCRLRKFPQLL